MIFVGSGWFDTKKPVTQNIIRNFFMFWKMKHQHSNNSGRCLNHTSGRSENYGCNLLVSILSRRRKKQGIEISRKPEQHGNGDHDDDLPVDQ